MPNGDFTGKQHDNLRTDQEWQLLCDISQLGGIRAGRGAIIVRATYVPILQTSVMRASSPNDDCITTSLTRHYVEYRKTSELFMTMDETLTSL